MNADWSVAVDETEVLRARSLAPLVKARGLRDDAVGEQLRPFSAIRRLLECVIPTVAVFPAEGGIWRRASVACDGKNER